MLIGTRYEIHNIINLSDRYAYISPSPPSISDCMSSSPTTSLAHLSHFVDLFRYLEMTMSTSMDV